MLKHILFRLRENGLRACYRDKWPYQHCAANNITKQSEDFGMIQESSYWDVPIQRHGSIRRHHFPGRVLYYIEYRIDSDNRGYGYAYGITTRKEGDDLDALLRVAQKRDSHWTPDDTFVLVSKGHVK